METNLEKAKRLIKVNALVSGIELPDDGFIMQMLELAATPNKLTQADVMRSASDFKEEILKKLTQFYAYGDEYGYSNAELSRMRNCITKVEETPV